MGALATDSFTADGTQRSFVVTSTILSESHVRVHFYYDDESGNGYQDHPIPSSQWDLLGNAILFNEPPTSGYVVKITTSSDGEGLDDAPTQYGLLASNVDKLIDIADTVVPNINEILLADEHANTATTKATEASNSETTATEQAIIATTKASEALSSANNASTSESNASTSETNSATSELNASTSESNALTYRNEAKTFRDEANTSASNALTSEQNAEASANLLDADKIVHIDGSGLPNELKQVNLSRSASNVLINMDSVSIANSLVTKNFAIVPYTGNGASQDIVTGIDSVDFTKPNNGSGYYLDREGASPNGVELVTNGTFDTDTSGWVDEASGLSWENSKAKYSSSTSGLGAIQTISTEIGEKYIFSIDVADISVGTNHEARVVIDNELLLQLKNGEEGIHTLVFTATSTSTIIKFYVGGNSGITAYFDNISVQKLVGNLAEKNTIKTDAGTVVTSGACDWGTNKGVSKVHIKNLTIANRSHIVCDGLRGATLNIYTDATNAESAPESEVTSFISNGISIGTGLGANQDTEDFILYQTLYTHIKWGTTNQGKFYVEAYNPKTKEGMIYYIGSGQAGHEIPHSMGVEIDYKVTKCLTTTYNWVATKEDGKYLYINSTNSEAVSAEIQLGTNTSTIVGLSPEDNASNQTFILYYKCKSETFTIGTYTGTGVAGNFIETKDVNGVARRPARAIIKRIDGTYDWGVLDNKRNNGKAFLALNTSSAEVTPIDGVSFNYNGFTMLDLGATFNTLGGQYLYLVEFDTNGDGGDSYYDYPTDDTNLNLVNSQFNFTNGIENGGYKLDSETVNGVIDFTGVSDGYKWIGRKLDGSYVFRDTKPTFNTTTGLYDGEVESLSFLPYRQNVVSETPQGFDYSDRLYENQMVDLEVGKVKADEYIGDLPTSDPFIRNMFWNDSGTLKISSGV